MSEELTIASPEVQDLATSAAKTLDFAGVCEKIDSPETYEILGGEIRDIKAKMKIVNDTRLNITRPMDAAKKGVMDFFKAPLEQLQQAEKLLNRLMMSSGRRDSFVGRFAIALATYQSTPVEIHSSRTNGGFQAA